MRSMVTIAVFGCVAGLLPRAYALSDSDVETLTRYHGAGVAKWLNEQLSPQAKTEAKELLRAVTPSRPLKIGGYSISETHAKELLCNLGDHQSLAEAYEQFLNGKTDEGKARFYTMVLGPIRHPQFMVVLGRDIDRPVGESYMLRAGTRAYEVPYANAELMMWIASSRGFFSEEVQRWAKTLEAKEYPSRYLEEMRAFWTANREKIEKGSYDMVRPPDGAPRSATQVESTRIVKPPAAVLAPKEAETKKSLTSGVAADIRGPVWPWIVGGGALLLVVFFMAKRLTGSSGKDQK